MRLEVIQGGAVKAISVLTTAAKKSIATRFLVHGAAAVGVLAVRP